jgi:hypothetical protein
MEADETSQLCYQALLGRFYVPKSLLFLGSRHTSSLPESLEAAADRQRLQDTEKLVVNDRVMFPHSH